MSKSDKKHTKNIKLNRFYIGDNLKLVKNIEDKSIDLIYIDPPYNTGRNFYDFDDNMTLEEYTIFMKERLKECKRILKSTGTIIIHVEPRISHYFRFWSDVIFGINNFRNEIIWITHGNAKNKHKLNRFHDTLLVYSASSKQTFNPIYFPYDDIYRKKSNVKCDDRGEYVTTALYNNQPEVNPRPNLVYKWKGVKKQWYVSREKMKELDDDDRLEYNSKGVPRIKRYLDEMDGIPLRDVWSDISNVQIGEKLHYATQKPQKLLERIVTLYSNEDDVCLDIFAGSGVLGRACVELNRNYILFDINSDAKKVFKESIT